MEYDGLNHIGKDDAFLDGDDAPMADLKAAAFEFLLLNPGSEFGDWRQGLIEQYPTEVVDALGCDPEEVSAGLAALWECDYLDPASGMKWPLRDWALCFRTARSADLYYRLVEVTGRTDGIP